MEAFSIEKSIHEGEKEVKELFDFIQKNAENEESYEIEKKVFLRIMKIGLCAMKAYFAEKGTGDVGEELEIEGSAVLKKESGLRGRDYFSVFGKLKVPRTCYRKEGHKGVMPLDAQANLPERCYSYLLQEWMDLFSIRDSFGEAEVSLERMLGLNVKQSRLEVVSRETSKNYDKFYENKEVPPKESEGKIKVGGFDGKGVPMIKREAAKIKARLGKGEKRLKKKESLVGISYTVDEKVRTAKEVAENLVYPEKTKEKRKEKESVKAKNVRRLASVERPKEDVMKEILQDVENRDPEHQKPLVIVIDGALHLWEKVRKILFGIAFIGILDIIHVTEYLWNVANTLYGEKSDLGRKWVYEHLVSILEGSVGRVIGGLRQTLTKQKLRVGQRKTIESTITYFQNHLPWMQYDKYLKAGYPIATGVVESSCGLVVQDRMEGTGRRWSVEGAESTLLLRSIYTSDHWNPYWEAHRSLEKKRLYEGTLAALTSPIIKKAA